MHSLIATAVFALLILGLFWLDRDRKAKTSWALLLPTVWLFIASSRNVAEWFASGPMTVSGEQADRYLDGNPLDRNVMTGLLIIALVVLFRRRKTMTVLRSNLPILLFFFYCALSAVWSDHPDLSLKRWVKAIGDLVMALIVLTDEDSLAAMKQLFKQVGFLVIPLSILFIRFYSDLGRVYNPWDGGLTYTGVTTNKNQLGMICLIFGLAAAWRILEVLMAKRWARTWGTLIANGVIVATGLWLIRAADSMTPFACFALAGGVMVLCSLRSVASKPLVIHLLVVSVLAVAFSALFLGIGSGLVQNLGRDSTLTGRTDIWNLVLPMTPSAWLGAGYESFWTGDRLQKIWSVYWNHPNQAHNGYIEIYLNLGWIGVTLLAIVIITAYRKLVVAVRRRSDAATLRIAYFIVAVAYNFTEAAFKMTNPVWIVFLLATTFVPEATAHARAKLKAAVKVPAPLAELPLTNASA